MNIYSKIKQFLFLTTIFILTIGCLNISAQENIVEKAKNFGNLIIEITDFESDDGQAIISIFNSEETWPKVAINKVYQEIKNNKCIVEFENLPFGYYGVAVIHDDNNNSEMDTNFLGIPSEDYGFSNDAEPSFGPASWEDAKFSIDKPEVAIKIKIQ